LAGGPAASGVSSILRFNARWFNARSAPIFVSGVPDPGIDGSIGGGFVSGGPAESCCLNPAALTSSDGGVSDVGASDVGPSDVGPSDGVFLSAGSDPCLNPAALDSSDGGPSDVGASDVGPSDGGFVSAGSDPCLNPAALDSSDGGASDVGASVVGASDGGSSDGPGFASTLDRDCQTTNIRAKLRRTLNILIYVLPKLKCFPLDTKFGFSQI